MYTAARNRTPKHYLLAPVNFFVLIVTLLTS